MSAPNDRLIDKRIVKRNLEKGLVSNEQFSSYLGGLPDMTGNAEYVSYDASSRANDEGEEEE